MNSFILEYGYTRHTFTIALPLSQRIEELARKWRMSKSKVVNLAIITFLQALGEDLAVPESPELKPIRVVDLLEEATDHLGVILKERFGLELVEEVRRTKTTRVFKTNRGIYAEVSIEGSRVRGRLWDSTKRWRQEFEIPIEVGE